MEWRHGSEAIKILKLDRGGVCLLLSLCLYPENVRESSTYKGRVVKRQKECDPGGPSRNSYDLRVLQGGHSKGCGPENLGSLNLGSRRSTWQFSRVPPAVLRHV